MTIINNKLGKGLSSLLGEKKLNLNSGLMSIDLTADKVQTISIDLLRCFFTKFTVFSNCPNPSSAKYSHCTGIKTELDAVNAFKVINPNDGGQSIIM